jgi:hypothetical protein
MFQANISIGRPIAFTVFLVSFSAAMSFPHELIGYSAAR